MRQDQVVIPTDTELLERKEQAMQESTAEPDYWEKLRHQFAGQALPAVMSGYDPNQPIKNYAKVARRYADALIAELKVVK